MDVKNLETFVMVNAELYTGGTAPGLHPVHRVFSDQTAGKRVVDPTVRAHRSYRNPDQRRGEAVTPGPADSAACCGSHPHQR